MLPPPMKRGFTLVELLAALAIVAVLAAMILPALAQVGRSADNAACLASLRQIGIGIQGYCNDHDGTLPGPMYSGVYPVPYTTSLTYFIAPYLNLPIKGVGGATYPPPEAYSPLLCPAYKRAVSANLWSQGFAYQVIYALRGPGTNPSFVNNGSGGVSPWGHDGTGVNNGPLRLVALETLVQANKTWAVEDADAVSYSATSIAGLAPKPVHGGHWNKLYFDWHVESSTNSVSNP